MSENMLHGDPLPVLKQAHTMNHISTTSQMNLSLLDAGRHGSIKTSAAPGSDAEALCPATAAAPFAPSPHHPSHFTSGGSPQLPTTSPLPDRAGPPTTTATDAAPNFTLPNSAFHIPRPRPRLLPPPPTPGRAALSRPSVAAAPAPPTPVHPNRLGAGALALPAATAPAEAFPREPGAAPPPGVAWAAPSPLAPAPPSATWPPPPLPPPPVLFGAPPPAQWQQHMQALLALDRPIPARRPESRLLPLPAHPSGGGAGGAWAAGGAAMVLQHVLDTAAAEGRLRPAEAAAARVALAALVEGR
jgi:hypothetical protein